MRGLLSMVGLRVAHELVTPVPVHRLEPLDNKGSIDSKLLDITNKVPVPDGPVPERKTHGMSKLLIERHGEVTLFTLNRPEVHNNVDRDLAIALAEGIMAFGEDDAQKVLVITGAGDKTFCAGANLKGMNELWEHPYTYTRGADGLRAARPGEAHDRRDQRLVPRRRRRARLWCDFRIVATTPGSACSTSAGGLSFADGGTQRLPRVVGIGNALWMIETGMEIDAHRAQLIGLAQEVVPEGEALDRAMEIAQHITTYPQVGLRADRKAALATYGKSLEDGLQYEVESAIRRSVRRRWSRGWTRFVKGARPEPPRPRDAVRL